MFLFNSNTRLPRFCQHLEPSIPTSTPTNELTMHTKSMYCSFFCHQHLLLLTVKCQNCKHFCFQETFMNLIKFVKAYVPRDVHMCIFWCSCNQVFCFDSQNQANGVFQGLGLVPVHRSSHYFHSINSIHEFLSHALCGTCTILT